jgi:hypothetical protein
MSGFRNSHILKRRAPLALLLSLAGCSLLSKSTAPTETPAVAAPEPVGITIVQGNDQVAQAGRQLATPLVLRVVDAFGRGVPRQTASLIVATGGGVVDPATAVSDTNGEMRVRWTLGMATQSQTIQATVSGVPAVAVNATALFPNQVVLVQGGSQTGKVALPLKNDVVVRVVGPGSLPMVGVVVSFRVTEGGGALSAQSATTNALGEVAVKWTLGAVAGPNTLVATTGELAGVVVAAVAIP